MRIKIENPVFLDVEGPFTITPIYVAKKGPDIVNGMFDPEAERTPPVPKSVKRGRYTKSGMPKMKRKGHRATCYYCLEGYISHNGRRRFCSDAHRHAYMRVMDLHYPLSGSDKGRYAELLAKEPVRLAGKP